MKEQIKRLAIAFVLTTFDSSVFIVSSASYGVLRLDARVSRKNNAAG